MGKELRFNLADRDKHFDALKQLYGDSANATQKTNRQEADTKLTIADSNTERVSRVQGVLGICPESPYPRRQPNKTRQ